MSSGMTVAELVAKLQALPGDMRVVVSSDPEGFDDVKTVEFIDLVLDSRKHKSYGGNHEELSFLLGDWRNCQATQCVLLANYDMSNTFKKD